MSQNGVVRVYGKPNQSEFQIPTLSSGQAGPPSPAFPRRLLGSRLLTESLTNRCSATGGTQALSLVFGLSGEMQPLCVDVSVLTSRAGQSRSRGPLSAGGGLRDVCRARFPVQPRRAPPLRPRRVRRAQPQSRCRRASLGRPARNHPMR